MSVTIYRTGVNFEIVIFLAMGLNVGPRNSGKSDQVSKS